MQSIEKKKVLDLSSGTFGYFIVNNFKNKVSNSGYNRFLKLIQTNTWILKKDYSTTISTDLPEKAIPYL